MNIDQTLQTPHLDAYCTDDELNFYETQLGRTERANLELAFATLESTLIELHLYSNERASTLMTTISTINDNARQLADDEAYLESHPE